MHTLVPVDMLLIAMLASKFWSFVKVVTLCLTCLLLGVLGLASLAGFFGQFGHVIELTSHLRFLYAIGFVPLLLILLCLRQRKILGIGIVLFVINAAPIAQLYIPQAQAVVGANQTYLTLLQVNLWGPRNSHYDQVIELVRRESPDLIGISEITQTWETKLKEGLPEYPYQVIEKRFGGIALFSKGPLIEPRVSYFAAIKRPRITTKINVAGKLVTVILAHPVIPRWKSGIRNNELLEIATQSRDAETPVIVFGDLNCSPWSYYFGKLLEVGRLRDSERGFGLQPTWTTRQPFWNSRWYFPWVPIDHCLFTREFLTLVREVGPDVGSDHLPVLVKIGMREPH